MAITQHGLITPEEDADSAWWWDAVRRHELQFPQCQTCGKFFFPPQPSCTHCGSTDWKPAASTGTGSLYTWIVVHVALDQRFAIDTPYTIVGVDLDDGVRMFGRLDDHMTPTEGLRLRATFYEVDGVTLVGFAAADPGSAGAVQDADRTTGKR
ncbi:OB-fold domain-containing protein [Streptomyces sp. NPDC001982]|uniref:Zn-ribbon domain-containing OB-fold protein n=1 Tax=Streptomyces sp. NPDC001982 TaxID=3154405 RepID=UPI00331D0B9E